jgi:hypothetical protein
MRVPDYWLLFAAKLSSSSVSRRAIRRWQSIWLDVPPHALMVRGNRNHMPALISILDACADPQLFAPWFRKPDTWRGWFVFLKALFGLEMNDDDRALFEQCSGRTEPPAGGTREAWLVCGRRAGKSFVLV